jgi:hypothetical protein
MMRQRYAAKDEPHLPFSVHAARFVAVVSVTTALLGSLFLYGTRDSSRAGASVAAARDAQPY